MLKVEYHKATPHYIVISLFTVYKVAILRHSFQEKGDHGIMLPFTDILIRLLVALLLGAIIGWERESSDHSAGMRTNALVALGCALFTLISGYGFRDLLPMQHIQLDPTRIASYIVAGIGFLGGGAIFIRKDNKQVKGMTTAAAIWIVAAVGMGCGAGMLWEAIITTGLALLVLIVMRYLEASRFMSFTTLTYDLDMTLRAETEQASLVNRIHDICARYKIVVKKLYIRQQADQYYVQLVCEAPSTVKIAELIDQLRQLPYVQDINMELGGDEKIEQAHANMRA